MMTMQVLAKARKFTKQQDGAMTAFGLFMFMCSVVIGGLAIDVANAYMVRTQLQATADAAAHAAIYTREFESESAAIQAALDVAEVMMPAAQYGAVLTASDIQFGTWDRTAQVFTASAGSRSGVFVDIQRSSARTNSVGTFFLRMAGISGWDVRRGTVYETYYPTCMEEGYAAEGVVDTQSNNTFTNGFCVHSNTHVEVNNNNVMDSGVIISMPDVRDVVIPTSGNNTGVDRALRDGAYQFRILNKLPRIEADLAVLGPEYTPDFITYPTILNLPDKRVDASDFTSGYMHEYYCTGGQRLTIEAHTTLTDVGLITNCEINFGNNVVLENVIIYTSNTNSDSVNASHVRLGRDDDCAADGGVQILTMGGFKASSGLEVFGSQIIAKGDIEFTANANGIEGASFIAGGDISATSNATMGFCGWSGMERNLRAEYFRIAA